MDEDQPAVGLSPIVSISSCLLLSVIYVGSLHIWSAEHNRDHPSTIKKRFFSVTIVMLISPLFIQFTSSEQMARASLWKLMGFRQAGFWPAFILPLVLTAILFLGPLAAQIFNGIWRVYFQHQYWLNSVQNLLWLRNHIVAPLSEEFTFRAAMLPILLQSFSPKTAILITPLFFGVAHLHHIQERRKSGMELKTILIISCFQFIYTSIFGMYSAYLFVRTGHFIAPFAVHAFCNHMGFPDFQEVFNHNNPKRCILLSLYVLGLCGFILLLPALTVPDYFTNDLFWTQ